MKRAITAARITGEMRRPVRHLLEVLEVSRSPPRPQARRIPRILPGTIVRRIKFRHSGRSANPDQASYKRKARRLRVGASFSISHCRSDGGHAISSDDSQQSRKAAIASSCVSHRRWCGPVRNRR